MEEKLNKIENKDCLEYLKELPDKCVDLVLIDPPYEIATKGGNHFNRKDNFKTLEPLSKGIKDEVLEEICRVLKKINCYIFCSKKQIPQFLNFFIKKEAFFDVLTWHKTNPVPFCGDSYLPDTEYILFFREKGVYFGGSFETKRKYFISALNTSDKKLYQHPTIKPISLLKNYIINSTKENDIVLDCFAGSGSTAIASKILNRNFLGCEISEKYCEIANKRLKEHEPLFKNL